MRDQRKLQLYQWLSDIFQTEDFSLSSLDGDAGFRRYFRASIFERSYILVDSPVEKCNNQAFVDVQRRLIKQSIKVPEIIHYHPEQGFFCLSDLGTTCLGNLLAESNAGTWYRQAMAIIPEMAACEQDGLPLYDADFVQLELDIFEEWLLNAHLGLSLSAEDKNKLQSCFDVLIKSALEQPYCFMHRDFHCRNLMVEDGQIAVIDFQDAVKGPISYDLVSLLRDCYQKWPEALVSELLAEFVEKYSPKVPDYDHPLETWQRWFDLMGLQRHIKACGIFARLHHRDGKSGYLKDIPLTLSYIVDISSRYPELSYLHQFSQTLPVKITESH